MNMERDKQSVRQMIVLVTIISMLFVLLQVLGEKRIFANNIIDEEKKDFVYGDVNDDGIVDIKDVALIKRKISGWNVTLGPVREEEGQEIASDNDVPIETVVEKETTNPIEESDSIELPFVPANELAK